jgi:hypothetical protein
LGLSLCVDVSQNSRRICEHGTLPIIIFKKI